MKRNILFIYLGHDTGGPVKSMIQLIDCLNKDSFNIYVLSLSDPHKESLYEIEKIKGVEIIYLDLWINNWLHSTRHKVKLSLWKSLKSRFRFVRTLYNSIQISNIASKYKIDLIHSNIELVAEGALAAYILRIKHLWHIRAEIARNGAVNHRYGETFALKIINALSSSVVANSRATFRSLETGISQKKLHLVHNGITPAVYKSANKSYKLRSKYNIKDSTIIVAGIGYVSETKGTLQFVEVAAKVIQSVSDVVFVYVGPAHDGGDKECLSACIGLAENNNILEHVLFTGYRDDIPDILSEVDILFQPMMNGSWSRVVLEGMASERPVVALETSMTSDFITHGTTGLLGRNYDACANHIIELIINREKRLILGSAAKKYVFENFSNEITARKIENIYTSLLNR